MSTKLLLALDTLTIRKRPIHSPRPAGLPCYLGSQVAISPYDQTPISCSGISQIVLTTHDFRKETILVSIREHALKISGRRVGGQCDHTVTCLRSWPTASSLSQKSVTHHARLSSHLASDLHRVGLIVEFWSRHVSSIALPRLYVRLDKPITNGQNSQGNRKSNVYPKVSCNFDI